MDNKGQKIENLYYGHENHELNSVCLLTIIFIINLFIENLE